MIEERSFLMYFLLSIITCGIYPIIFFYKYTQDINIMCYGDGQESPNYIVVWLLSLVTCGIYSIIWQYIQANRLQIAGNKYGVSIVENGTTVLLWILLGSFLCGLGLIMVPYILIKNFNIVANSYNSGSSPSLRKQ